MRLWSPFIALFALCAVTSALREAEVGAVDWHKQLIGVPLAGSVSTSPSFHWVENRSLVIVATESNVLAALEPENGSVVWRHVFDPEDRIAGYYRNGSVVATLSGAGVRTFNATTGEILREKRLHASQVGSPVDPVHIGRDVVFARFSADLYVLTNGHTVIALDGDTGEVKWRWTSPDQASLIIHNKLVLIDNKLYVIGFAKSSASYTLHVTILNPSTAQVLRSSNIPANIPNPWTESAIVTHPSFAHPMAVWLEKGILRFISLTPNLSEKPKSAKGSGYVQIKDVGVNGQVVVVRQNGLGAVIGLEGDQITTKPLWEFEDAPNSPNNSDSIYVSSLDAKGRSYVGRIFWSHSLQQGSTDVFARHILQGQATGTFFPYDIKQHGIIKNVALDSSNPYELTVKSRLLVVTSTGSIQLWDEDNLRWTREEGLASITAAQFVEIPERVGSEGTVDHDSEGFIPRLLRHVSSLQDFPRYAINFATRFATGSYALPSTTAVSNDSSMEGLYRDPFGFRQIIVTATRFGKVYGVDSGNGKIIWNRILGLGWAEKVGGHIIPVKIHVMKTVSDGGDPEVVLVTQRRADNGLIDTVAFHLDAMTGRDITGQTADGVLQGQDIIQGPLVESFSLNNEAKMAILLDEFLQVYLYPDIPLTQTAFKNIASNLSFPLLGQTEGTSRVIGHQISLSDDKFRPIAYPTWSLGLAPGEVTQAIIPPTTRGPIASFGKVLGNRTTLYKYLNPRLFTFLTAMPTKARCGLYVLDSMKGTIVYRSEVNANARGCEIKTALIDNWLVYHYYDDTPGTGAKGYKMVSVEFYEGKGIDEKTRSIELSAFSDENIHFHTYEQSYILPSAVTALTSTTTRFGISNKDIIIATKDHKIHFIPRAFLNPRRPNRKPTAAEAEEMLVQYDPVIPNDPKRVLSHNYEVANIQNIITSPALLESTSLIFAYGLDMFLTRMAPSGTFDVLSENFNKVQLVLTVCGLFVAILITRPMVRRKQLRERWYQ